MKFYQLGIIASAIGSLVACGGGGGGGTTTTSNASTSSSSSSNGSGSGSGSAATATVASTIGCGSIADSAARGTIGQPHGTQALNSIVDIVNPDLSLYTNTVGANTITVNVNPTQSNSKLTAVLYCYTNDGAVNPTPVATSTTAVSSANSALGVPINVPFKGLYQLELTMTDSNGNTEGSPKITTYTAMALNTPNQATQFGVSTHAANDQGNLINNVSFPRHLTANLSLMAKAGFARIRDNFYWINSENPLGTFLFGYDEFVNGAASYNLQVLGILGYTNTNPSVNITAFPTTATMSNGRTQMQEFAAYAGALAGHYTSIANWEVYNEANSVSMSTYADLADLTYNAIKTANPAAKVAACAGTVPSGQGDGGVLGDCVKEIYAKYGKVYDTWTTHPYMSPAAPDIGFSSPGSPLGSKFSIDSVSNYELNAVANVTGAPNVWFSETGWYSNPAGTAPDAFQDERAQAAYVARAFLTVRKYPGVGAMFIYDFQDDGIDATNSENNFGLIRADFSPKPAYVAMSVMANSIGDKAYTGALMNTSTDRVYQYSTGVGSVIAGWTTYQTAFNTSDTVTVAVPSGTYTLRSWDGGESTVTITGNSYAWTIGPLPQYLIRIS